MEPSKKYELNKVDLLKAGRLFLVALAGTFLTLLTQFVGDFNFGDWTPLVATAVSALVEVGRRFLTNYSQK